jgi:hypothetical protein
MNEPIITLLQNMYNDNLNQIHNLQQSNINIQNYLSSYLLNIPIRTEPIRQEPIRQEPIRQDTIRQEPIRLRQTLIQPQLRRNIQPSVRRRPDYFILDPNNSFDFMNLLFSELNNEQPPPPPPTQEQINCATMSVKYSSIISPKNQTCPISHNAFNDNDDVMMIKYCGHIFNPVDLTTWFQNHSTCPVCRYNICNS